MPFPAILTRVYRHREFKARQSQPWIWRRSRLYPSATCHHVRLPGPGAALSRSPQAHAALAGRGRLLHGVAGHHHPEHRGAGDRQCAGDFAAQHEVGAVELYPEPGGVHSRSAAGWPTVSARGASSPRPSASSRWARCCAACRPMSIMLVACRILQGCGGAMMVPVGRLTLVRTFPKFELVRAMSFVAIPGLGRPDAGPHRRRPDRRLSALARHLLPQPAGGHSGIVSGLSPSAGLSREDQPSARHHRADPVRRRDRASVLCAGDFRRTFAQHRRSTGAAGDLAGLAVRLCAACPAHHLAAACSSGCSASAPSPPPSAAASSPGWASAACRFFCPCSIRKGWG